MWNMWGPDPASFNQEAAWEIVGRPEGPQTGWSVYLSGDGERGGVVIHMDDAGRFQIDGGPWNPKLNPSNVKTDWTEHSAIRKGTVFNTLLLLVRARRLEMYVNHRAVCLPIPLDSDIRPVVLQAGVCNFGRGGNLRRTSEVRRFAVWYRTSLPEATLIDERPAAAPPAPPAWSTDELRAGKIAAPNLNGLATLTDDRFTDPASGFPAGKIVDDVDRGYQGGHYFIHRPTRGTYLCPAPLPDRDREKHGRDFACRVAGKLTESPGSWGVALRSPAGSVAPVRAAVVIDEAGRLHIETGTDEEEKVTRLPPVVYPRLKSGLAVENTLLVVVRGGRLLEVYVNGLAVCAPLVLQRELTAPWLWLVCRANADKPAHAEFQTYTVWRMNDFPQAERAAAK
jgi:hypothetical protein